MFPDILGALRGRAPAEPEPVTRKPVRVPQARDPYELDVMLKRLDVLVELRCTFDNEDEARERLAEIEGEVHAALSSPLRNHEWSVRREALQGLIADLEYMLETATAEL